MTRTAFNRMLLLVHGQGDELATPQRTHACDSSCLDGCPLDLLTTHPRREAEYESDVPPNADRVIQPPEPLPDDLRARLRRRALYLSALGFGVMAGLLEAFGALPFDRTAP